jgi:hypothetical protein
MTTGTVNWDKQLRPCDHVSPEASKTRTGLALVAELHWKFKPRVGVLPRHGARARAPEADGSKGW